MKTIFITILQAVVVKNILRTGTLREILKNPKIQAVCVTRNQERADYYKKELPHERTTYDIFYNSPKGTTEKIFSFLKLHTIVTKTTDLLRKMHRHDAGNWLEYFLGIIFNRIVSLKPIRKIIRFFDYHLIKDLSAIQILEKYNPDVVFITNAFDDVETSILREAKKKNILTIGFINSWDRLTSRWAIRIRPDYLIVYSEEMKQDAIDHLDMPSEKIFLAGVSQYDHYINVKPIPKNEYFKKHDLDPTKHLILVAPEGGSLSDNSWGIIDLLDLIINQQKLVPNAQMLVRFKPNDFIQEKEKEEFRKRPWLKYDLPGIRYGSVRGGDWDMTEKDLLHLKDSLAYSSVLVGYASSISIDAAIMDLPIININFETNSPKKLVKSPTYYYKTEHYGRVLRSGGIRLVHNKNELVYWMNKYIENPDIDREKRKKIVQEHCWKADGKSSERISNIILKLLHQPS